MHPRHVLLLLLLPAQRQNTLLPLSVPIPILLLLPAQRQNTLLPLSVILLPARRHNTLLPISIPIPILPRCRLPRLCVNVA